VTKPRALGDECDSIIDLVNASITRIEQLSTTRIASDADSISHMRETSEAWDDLAGALRRLDIADRNLRDKRRLYVSMARRAASAAARVASSLESKDMSARRDAQKELDDVVAEEDDVVNQLNALCQRTE
jgi:hypothetical protein